jgi:hypothetical protein
VTRDERTFSATRRRAFTVSVSVTSIIGRMARRPATGGRPSKGNREPLLTRAPADLAQVVRDEADRLGLSYSDYIANVLADKHGFPQVAEPKNDAQMKLTA